MFARASTLARMAPARYGLTVQAAATTSHEKAFELSLSSHTTVVIPQTLLAIHYFYSFLLPRLFALPVVLPSYRHERTSKLSKGCCTSGKSTNRQPSYDDRWISEILQCRHPSDGSADGAFLLHLCPIRLRERGWGESGMPRTDMVRDFPATSIHRPVHSQTGGVSA